MAYLRMTIARWDVDLASETGRAQVRAIQERGLEIFRQQPGFIRYRLMQAGPRVTVAVAEWENEELGQPGAQRYRDWMRQSGVADHISLETWDGPILIAS